ncbi:MAG: prepilin-type N-terminal cleavage/methylation domain-containing protein [Thermoanaerobaculaceae bacterium]
MNCVSGSARRREAGVTLFEALVVLLILGLVTAIVTVPVNSYWQRARLQSAAGDIRNFLQIAYTEAVNQHAQITVTMQQVAGQWQLQISPPPLSGSATYTFPDVVDCTTLNPASTAGGWPLSSSQTSVRAILCDPRAGMTEIPVGFSGSMVETGGNPATATTPVQEVKTLSITHTSMVGGSLTPYTRYDIQIYPVWNVSYQKWAQENGIWVLL